MAGFSTAGGNDTSVGNEERVNAPPPPSRRCSPVRTARRPEQCAAGGQEKRSGGPRARETRGSECREKGLFLPFRLCFVSSVCHDGVFLPSSPTSQAIGEEGVCVEAARPASVTCNLYRARILARAGGPTLPPTSPLRFAPNTRHTPTVTAPFERENLTDERAHSTHLTLTHPATWET